jgi:hypothetical protein
LIIESRQKRSSIPVHRPEPKHLHSRLQQNADF